MSITFWMVSSAPEKNCRQKIPPKKAAPLAPSSEVLGASHWEGPKPRSPTSATRPQGSGPGLPINPRESRLFPGLYSQGLRWELDLEVHLRDGPSQVVPVAEFWDVLGVPENQAVTAVDILALHLVWVWATAAAADDDDALTAPRQMDIHWVLIVV